jgi:hypothetical protein
VCKEKSMRTLITILIVLAMAPAQGQTPDPPQPPVGTVLRDVVPNPTGTNGYEDLILAGEWLRFSKLMFEAEQGPLVTLRVKRATLDDPPVQRALTLLKSGLAKPVFSPRTDLDEQTRFPEFALFRRLARLLGIKLYVEFADGRTSQAIDTLRDGLKLGYVAQTDSLISGLVAIAIDAIVMRQFSDHLEQLSSRDCDRLIALAHEWVALPDPAIKVMASEKQLSLKILNKYRTQPEELFKILAVGTPNGEESARAGALRRSLQDNPAAVGALFDQAAAKLSARFDEAIQSLQKPVWERKDPPALSGSSPDELLMSEMVGDAMARSLDRYSSELAQVQMLGVWAGIRKFRWEFNRLPGSLEEVKLGKLMTDPFTGKPFVYRRLTDTTFELSSAGPMDRGSEERPASGQRVSVFMPYRSQSPP